METNKQYTEIISQLAVISVQQNVTNEHLKQLNGKVVSHEDKLILMTIAEKEMLSTIAGLTKTADIAAQTRRDAMKIVIERILWIATIIALIVLQRTGVVNLK